MDKNDLTETRYGHLKFDYIKEEKSVPLPSEVCVTFSLHLPFSIKFMKTELVTVTVKETVTIITTLNIKTQKSSVN